jgi:hypothetical protein
MKIKDMSESDQAEFHAVLAATEAIDGISPNLDILEEMPNPLEVVRYAYLRTCRIHDVTPKDNMVGNELTAKESVDDGLFAHLDEEFDPDDKEFNSDGYQ